MFGSLAPTLTAQNIYGGGVASQSAPNTTTTASGAASTGGGLSGPQSPVATFVVAVLLLVGLRVVWELAD